MKLTGLYILSALAAGATIGAAYTHVSTVSAAPDLVCRGLSKPMARLEMLFGTSRAKGGAVSEEEWSSFLDTEVTPRFPAGLTVLKGPGQWRGNDGKLTKEQSNILVIWHEPSSRTEADIEASRSAYKARFDQESVMRVDSLSCVSF
jgi:hypothetical protein